MRKYLIKKLDINENDEQVFYDKFSKKNLQLRSKINYRLTCKDPNITMLTMQQTTYQGIGFIKHIDICLYNQDKKIYKTEEFLAIDDKGNSRTHTVDIGCFPSFFGVIGYFRDKIDDKTAINLTLSAYDYSGKFLGSFNPSYMYFKDYSEDQLAKFEIEVALKQKSELTNNHITNEEKSL